MYCPPEDMIFLAYFKQIIQSNLPMSDLVNSKFLLFIVKPNPLRLQPFLVNWVILKLRYFELLFHVLSK